jgi:hypothetical protein
MHMGKHRRTTRTSKALKKLGKMKGLRPLAALSNRGTSAPSDAGAQVKG